MGDFMDPLADLIREQAWDEEAARWRRHMRRMWVGFWIVSFAVTTACYTVVFAAAR